MRRVAIIHPWMPQYRQQFFELLTVAARTRGVEIDIFHGSPPREWRARGDAAGGTGFIELPTRFINVQGRDLNWKSLGPFFARGPYDLVVLEQAVRNLETYRLLIHRQGARLAFWGHGRTYTKPIGAVQTWVKEWLTRQGDWFFAYTEGGAAAVAHLGFPRDRITMVQNSIDTNALKQAVVGVKQEALAAFTRKLDLRGKTALFLGGLDEPKRLPFLVEASRRAHDLDADFRLVVAGAVSLQGIIEQAAATEEWITYVGPVFGGDKATALAASQVLAMPGRVGLVAVDSFAAGIPVVTTDWEWHAPEFEYLQPGRNAVISADDVEDYAQALVRLLRNPDGLEQLATNCRADSEVYTVDAMVANFTRGILGALEAGAR